MNTAKKLMLGMLRGAGSSGITSYADDFTGDAGLLSSPWITTTFARNGSGRAVNTPTTFGAETLVGGDMEGSYTAGLCDAWAVKNGSPTVTESADAHGGTKAQGFASTAASQSVRILATPSVWARGTWVQATEWAKRVSGTGTQTQFELRSTGWTHRGIAITAAAYTQLVTQALVITANSMEEYGAIETGAGGAASLVMDDVSMKAMTTSELFAVIPTANTAFTAEIDVTIAVGVYGGLVLCLDDPVTPQNYLIVFNDKGRLQAVKVVAGVPTFLFATNATYADDRRIKVVKSGTTFQFFYNNVQIGADTTISDASLINNTYHGLFATHATATMTDFSITA